MTVVFSEGQHQAAWGYASCVCGWEPDVQIRTERGRVNALMAHAVEAGGLALARVTEVLDQADSGEFATAGRDFGRGVAEMARRVRAALDSGL